jgi:hypothetical protein
LYYRPDAMCYHLRRDRVPPGIRTWRQWGARPRATETRNPCNLLDKTKEDLRWCLRYLAEDNQRHLRLRVTGVDFLLLFYSIYADLGYCFLERRWPLLLAQPAAGE